MRYTGGPLALLEAQSNSDAATSQIFESIWGGARQYPHHGLCGTFCRKRFRGKLFWQSFCGDIIILQHRHARSRRGTALCQGFSPRARSLHCWLAHIASPDALIAAALANDCTLQLFNVAALNHLPVVFARAGPALVLHPLVAYHAQPFVSVFEAPMTSHAPRCASIVARHCPRHGGRSAP